ncbi:MAG: bifunctional (p)ppGpp synthetase/guanosine-3',5'-bis(diphosphate) 3'-pyrophosphohydrolase [Actinomycetota bacterium]
MEERFAPDESRRRGVLGRLRTVEAPASPGLDQLVRRVRTQSPKADLKMIEKAYEFAAESHREQFRVSGDPFIEHPLAVAEILADLGLDTITLSSALLHDVVEDTPLTLDDIETEFGPVVREIIDGLTKLDKIEFRTREQHQAENMRKMMLAIARDPRVLLIKLADRLHNMRTIGHLPRDKQEAKARETIEIYSPLANRLGIHQIRWQLEDLSFATLYPKQFDEIVRMVEERQPERDALLASVVADLDDALKRTKIKAEVSGRPKHYYSIYEKMIVRGKEFGEIFDLVGIRVLVEDVRDCYGALGTIHALWKPVPGRFKDYIAMPKFNMYQSLHTAVLGPGGKPLEIQIRTQRMHSTAQYGIAAHWKYKEGKNAKGEADLLWLQQMLEWQKELSDPKEFMESLKIDLYRDEVFVFTPKGDVMAFPAGSTSIDFAYSIHTEVGHRCIGARVNGRLVPLENQLETGDTVEVLTSKAPSAAPSQDWLSIVRTPRARNKIRQWFSRERREDAMERGREELLRALRREGIPIQATLRSDALAGVAKEMSYTSLEALQAAIGEGHASAQAVAQRIAHEALEEDDVAQQLPTTPVRMRPPSEHGVVVKGIDDVLARLARCCSPVPGDPIIGFVTRGRGVSVHRNDCPNGKALAQEAGRLLEVSWDTARQTSFQVSILVEALDRTKLLRDVTTAISDLGVNILATSSQTNPRTRTAALKFTFELADPAHLEHIIAQVKRIEAVYDAYRLVPGRTSRAGG